MAINKNFVIKNGVQVSTDLIIGDADTNKVGIGTTVPGYELHVGVARGSRGGIGATDLVVSGVATVTNLDVTGLSTFAGALDVNGTVDFSKDVVFNGTNDITYDQSESALVFNDGAAIRVGTSSDFSISHDGSNTILRENGTGDLQIYASRIELGGASVDETMAVFTENSAAELWFNNTKRFETVGHGATVFGDLIVSGVTTSQKLNVTGVATVGGALSLGDNIKAQFGTGGDLLIYHDSSNSYIDDQGTGDLIIRGSADIKLQSASGENYIIANDTGSVEQYFDNSKKTETTSGGFKVTGITTLTNRLHVQAGVSTFDADVRFGIGATVGFGTSAFFRDDAAIFLGNDLDLKIHHDGSNSRIQDVGTGDLILQGSADIKLQSASAENYIVANDTGSVDIYFDNSKKVETTSGGLKVTGITTLTDRLHVEAGISTFDADVRFGIGATVGFGTSAFFRDDASAFFGNSQDLKIHHDGTDSLIENATGDLKLISTGDDINLSSSDDILLRVDTNKAAVNAKGGGQVILYYNAAEKFETTGIGATVFGDLVVSGVTTSARLLVSGISTFTGLVDINGGGQANTFKVEDLTDNRVVIAGTGGELEDSGNLTFDGSTLAITGDETVSGKITVGTGASIHATTGNAAFAGIVTTGGALIVGAGATISGDILPDADGSRDLGSSTLEFQDLFIDGTANIDSLSADTALIGDLTDNRVVIAGSSGELEDDANFTFDGAMLKVGTAATIAVNGNAAFAGIVTVGGDLNVIGDIVYDEITGRNLNITGISTQAGQVNFGTSGVGATVFANGNVAISGITTVGGALLVGAGVTVGGDILPDADGSRDLGSSTLEFQDLHLDGTANIDSLVADTADINGGTVDAANIGASTPGTGAFTTLSATTSATVGTAATIQVNGAAAFAGIVTANGGLSVGSNGSAGVAASIFTNGNASFSGIVTTGGALLVGGNLTLTSSIGAGTSTIIFDKSEGDLTFQDNIRAKFGTGSDLSIYHDGGNSFIDDNGTGDLIITGTVLRPRTDSFVLNNAANSQNMITATGGDKVTLFHAGSTKLVTDVGGVKVTGVATATGLAVDGGNINLGDSGSANDDRIVFGAGADLSIYHDGTDSTITNATNDLNITNTGDDINITAADDVTIKVQGSEAAIEAKGNAEVILYHNANARVTTTDDGTDFGGTGSIKVPVGTTGERNASPAAGDFRYNSTLGKFEGYTDEWGEIGGGSVEEVDTSVSTTSATSCGSFAIASFRSASIIAQITQGSAYQVGRYLVIHDGTTVTTIEESAVATGSMLGTFEGVINSSNLEFRVTMGSSSSATVTTKIDTVTV